MTAAEYISLITSQYQGQPNFAAVIAADVAPQVRVQDLLTSMLAIFDLDTPPVGDQLDIIGQWVGVSRDVSIPITGVYFTWDGAASLGWDYGVWAAEGSPASITTLPDDVYLILIKATIAANYWDGTTNGAYLVWDIFFTTVQILIQDNLDMSYNLIIAGGIVDSLTQALITGGVLNLRPEGVMIRNYYFSQGSNPIFAWDLNTSLMQGWDAGYWATQIVGT